MNQDQAKRHFPGCATALVLVGLSTIYAILSQAGFWRLASDNPGAFIGYYLGALALIPIAALIAAAPYWIAKAKNKNLPFNALLISSMVVVVVVLSFGATQKPRDDLDVGSYLNPSELAKIRIYDCKINLKRDGNDGRKVESISGVIRNDGELKLYSATITVLISRDKITFEKFDFTPEQIGYSAQLRPSYTTGFTYYPNRTIRFPDDAEWGCAVTAALALHAK